MSSDSDKRTTDHRKKWDVDEYEKLATERLIELEDKKHNRPIPIRRQLLKQREYKVDLDSKLGKTVVISRNTPSSHSGGYYCNVCDCVVKDSINFLDHINGKKHQRNLGMSMRIERSSVDQVKKRFEINKRKLDDNRRDYNLEQRVKELKEEEERLKEYRKDKKKEKKRKTELDGTKTRTEGVDPELAGVMGFSGFGMK